MTQATAFYPQNFDYYNFVVMSNFVFEEPKPVIYNSYAYIENGVYYCATATQKGGFQYAYCFNNPVMLIDPNGEAPGDPFKSKDAAAKDWGKYYNGASIVRGKEMGSSIYSYKENGKTHYSYTEAAEGTNDGVSPSKPSFWSFGKKTVGIIHSHGKYEKGYDNNNFSPEDKSLSDRKKVDGYVTTPDGSLKKYDVSTKTESVLSTDMPSDSKDPQRKNNNPAIDVPKVKENQTNRESQGNYRGTHGGLITVDP